MNIFPHKQTTWKIELFSSAFNLPATEDIFWVAFWFSKRKTGKEMVPRWLRISSIAISWGHPRQQKGKMFLEENEVVGFLKL